MTIVFVINESSTDLTLADLTVPGGPPSGLTGPGAIDTATFTPTANGEVKTVVFAACNTFSDLAGNRNVYGIAIAQ
ncbi:MAG: hypothetical protein EB072_13125 [Betaproteobacteria bacterium]|nr:hypothetical protein [Betaproteobacteria bacterium]